MIEKQLRKYIIPNILAMVGTSCYVLADTYFIALAEGADGITALNLILPVYGLIFALGSMIGVGSATRYALKKSVGDSEADDYFSNAVFCTLLISVLFILGGICCPEQILGLLGADAKITQLGVRYIRIILCFTPLFMLNYTATAFVRNDGAPGIAMAATLGSGIFNILFDYILMFPLQMGLTGAALATAVSPVVSMSICMRHYLSSENTVRFRTKLPSCRKFFAACSLGIAAFVGEISNGITTMVFNFILLKLAGNTGVAAYGIVANMALVGTALFNGVSLGLQPLASKVHGQGDYEAERRICRHALQIGAGIAVFLVAMVLLFTADLVGIFNSEQDALLAASAEQGLRLYFIGFLFASFNIVRTGFYSAVGMGREASILSVSRGIAAIVIFACLLSELFGMIGVWLAFPTAEIFTMLLGMVISNPKGKERKQF